MSEFDKSAKKSERKDRSGLFWAIGITAALVTVALIPESFLEAEL